MPNRSPAPDPVTGSGQAAPGPAWRRCPAPPRGVLGEDDDLDRRLYLLPSGIVGGEQAAAAIISGTGWPIADGPLAFTSAGIVWRQDGQAWIAQLPYGEMIAWSEGEGEAVARHMGRLVRRVGGARPPWGGVAMDRPRIMAIVNTTPDSFSDGGRNLDPAVAIGNALAMVEAGADIVDIGGESTRPGAAPVSVQAEIDRVLPVVAALAAQGVCVSVDTRNAAVMAAAVAHGAAIVNDIAALRGPGALTTVAAGSAALCLMHMQGEPGTMQAEPRYACAPLDVYDFLAERVAAAVAAGIDPARLCVDCGIGFGKNRVHNAQLLGGQALFHGLGLPLLLGASRKSFVAQWSRAEPADRRLPGTLAAHLAGLNAGVQVLRVHDVAETAQAVAVWHAMVGAG